MTFRRFIIPAAALIVGMANEIEPIAASLGPPPDPGEGRKSQRCKPEPQKQHTHAREIARKARQAARRKQQP